MIVKVQVSQYPRGRVLVYDEERSFQVEKPLTKEVRELMAGRPKAFFMADIDDDKVILGEEVADPGW